MNVDLKPSLIDLEVSDITTGRKVYCQRERLSERGVMYCVYWIRLPEHTNRYTEGYIGITKNFDSRIKSHKKNKKKSVLTDAAKKYGWQSFVIEIIHSNLSQQDCLDLERQYRPKMFIGWNMQTGGELGVDVDWYSYHTNKQLHKEATSLGTKLGIASNDTYEDRAQRARDSWIKTREQRIAAVTGENNPRALLNYEQVKEIKYKWIPTGLSNQEIAIMYNVRTHVINFIRIGKNWKNV